MNTLPTSRVADFGPTASWKALRLRAELLARVRDFFKQHGFLEVETPLLSADVVVDRYLQPLPVTVGGRAMWLQTSPEFHMKRMLAAGAEAIYQITRAFRGGESGALHNLEFTILEWYRVGDSPQQAMQFLSDLAGEMLGCGPAERLSYRQAFQRYLNIDPLLADVESLATCAKANQVDVPETMGSDYDSWLNLLLTEKVEPNLGSSQPTILYDYPASQAALAQIRSEGEVSVAERFELYLQGVELANGYHELLDAEELRQRNITANSQRAADGKQPLPTESRLLPAMQQGLPPCCGVALGFDRLVMLAAGADHISQVIPFPFDRA